MKRKKISSCHCYNVKNHHQDNQLPWFSSYDWIYFRPPSWVTLLDVYLDLVFLLTRCKRHRSVGISINYTDRPIGKKAMKESKLTEAAFLDFQ
mmetsp:Transcript_8814/g.11335  ORF Transcript_8814/g.11335 Transcript_8814/m.11335 type:complete len:93 (+) Transcript_8814:1310-1588(+)